MRVMRRPRGLGAVLMLPSGPANVPATVRFPSNIVYAPYRSPLEPSAPVMTPPLATQPTIAAGPVTAPAPVAPGPAPLPASTVAPTEIAATSSVNYAAEQGVAVSPFGPCDVNPSDPTCAGLTTTSTTTGIDLSGITTWLNTDSIITGVSNFLLVGAAVAAYFLLRKKGRR